VVKALATSTVAGLQASTTTTTTTSHHHHPDDLCCCVHTHAQLELHSTRPNSATTTLFNLKRAAFGHSMWFVAVLQLSAATSRAIILQHYCAVPAAACGRAT
jgi:hypothetical protein